MDEDFSRQTRNSDAVWREKDPQTAFIGCEYRF